MADINDFKLIKLKSSKMFDYIIMDSSKLLADISDLQKERLGFYHLILENITGVVEQSSNEYKIIDTTYNRIINNVSIDDLGIDAVYISNYEIEDSNEIEIKLFNFKYRENFNVDKTKTENDISRSTKFLEYISNNTILPENKNEIVYPIINEIINLLNSNKICNLTLYMVSNENKGFAESSNEYIKILENNFGMKVINISLDEIVSFFDIKKDIKSKFIISKDDFLSFQIDANTTQKSYIIKLSLLELIRITCKDSTLNNNYGLENDETIKDCKLEYSLLYDNVRGYLGETTTYNKNIIETLKNEHSMFFMFNNGITITSEKIECHSINSGLKYLYTLENFQIVNGGQTLKSIYNFLESNNTIENIAKLREAYILVRIFKTSEDDILKNLIAEYTNSQHAISDIDLKSVDPIQIQIEKYFEEMDILYARKAGTLGKDKKNYKHRISMEKLAQVLYSSIGYPDRASNQKKRLFGEYYNEIFKGENFSLETSKNLVETFFEIERHYKKAKSDYKLSDQKIFYIIYIITFAKHDIDNAIETLEVLLNQYTANVSEARKLIQKGFKDHINNKLDIIQ